MKFDIHIGLAMINTINKNLNDFDKMEQELVEFVSSIKNTIKRSN